MNSLASETIAVGDLPTRTLRGGKTGGTSVIFVHGGVPGLSPYCSGAHVWGDVLAAFAAERPVIALDLPGCGGTKLPVGELPSIDRWGKHLLDLIARQSASVHLVGHDEGALVALWAAMHAPAQIRSIALVASATAAPTGEMVENITLAYPPSPRWSRESQAWALDRVSYSHGHIDEALLDACEAAAKDEAQRALAAAMMQGGYHAAFQPSVSRTKATFYETCRAGGIPVPVQILWARNDPIAPVDRGVALFRDIAPRQKATFFSAINRSGNLVFREQPEAFHRTIAAFHDALA